MILRLNSNPPVDHHTESPLWRSMILISMPLNPKIPNLRRFPIFGQTLLSLSRWEYQATTMLHENLNAAHHRTSSLIQTNHQKNLRRSSKIYRMDLSRVSFLWFRRMVHTAQMKLMKRKFEQWWNSNIYPKFLSLSSTWQVFIIQ